MAMKQVFEITFGAAMWVIAAALMVAVGATMPPFEKMLIIAALGMAYLGGVAFTSAAYSSRTMEQK